MLNLKPHRKLIIIVFQYQKKISAALTSILIKLILGLSTKAFGVV